MKKIFLSNIASFGLATIFCSIVYLLLNVVVGNLFSIFFTPLIGSIFLTNIIRLFIKKNEEKPSILLYNIISIILIIVLVFSTFDIIYRKARDYYDYSVYVIIILAVVMVVSNIIVYFSRWCEKHMSYVKETSDSAKP